MPYEVRENGASVKAVGTDAGEWALDVLGCPYGGPANGKDAQGEYFAPDTKWHEDKFQLPPVLYYHGWTPDGRPASEPEFIGKTTSRRVDGDGVWYRVVLDRASAAAKRVWDAAKLGMARASSGAVSHLVRKGPDGHLLHWPVAELSLLDAAPGRQPANAYAVALPAMKSAYERAGMSLPDLDSVSDAEPIAGAEDSEAKAAPASVAPTSEAVGVKAHIDSRRLNVAEEMDIKTAIAEGVTQALKAIKDAEKVEADAATAAQAKIEEAVKAAKAEWKREEEVKARRLPGGMPYVTRFNDQRYDNLDVDDLATMVQILDGPVNGIKGSRLNDRELAYKSLGLKALSAEAKGHSASHEAVKAFGLKANELENSTLASYGNDWAGVLWSSRLWEQIRQPTSIVGRLPSMEVPQGHESITIPIDTTDPTFYKVGQAIDLAATTAVRPVATMLTSQVGTSAVSLTVGKLGARVIYTGEMEEDSIVPWIPHLRAKMDRAAAEQLEYVVIDGDNTTTASTNINDIVGTPAGTEAFLVFDGLRHCALTNNAVSVGTLTSDDYLAVLKLMGTAGASAAFSFNDVDFIIDPWTHWKSLDLPEVKTPDVAGNIGATLENGFLSRIWGHKINVSAFMHYWGVKSGLVTTAAYKLKANSAGKVDVDTEANNAYGAILAVRYDQWLLGWKRRVTVETERFAESDSSQIVVMMRVGLINRDTAASAIGYNVTV